MRKQDFQQHYNIIFVSLFWTKVYVTIIIVQNIQVRWTFVYWISSIQGHSNIWCIIVVHWNFCFGDVFSDWEHQPWVSYKISLNTILISKLCKCQQLFSVSKETSKIVNIFFNPICVCDNLVSNFSAKYIDLVSNCCIENMTIVNVGRYKSCLRWENSRFNMGVLHMCTRFGEHFCCCIDLFIRTWKQQ